MGSPERCDAEVTTDAGSLMWASIDSPHFRKSEDDSNTGTLIA